MRYSHRCQKAFTLIELLVVISILALLIGLLLPIFGSARGSARALASLSNLRQWGIGNAIAADESDGYLPWVGDSDADNVAVDLFGAPFGPPGFAFTKDRKRKTDVFWAHRVPPLLNDRSYRAISQTRADVPLPGDGGSLFIDPSAELPTPGVDTTKPGTVLPAAGAPYTSTSGANTAHFLFGYVPNSGMVRTLNNGDKTFPRRMRIDNLARSSATVAMLEMRTTRRELEGLDATAAVNAFRSVDLGRSKSNWKRFAARHQQGGHLLFADGHGAHYKYTDVIDHAPGDPDPAFRDAVAPGGGGYNRNDLIWDPLGAAR